LLNPSEGKTSHKTLLRDQVNKVCMDYVHVEMSDLEKTLDGMAADGLVYYEDGSVRLTFRVSSWARNGGVSSSRRSRF
jgi:hypothetical protein